MNTCGSLSNKKKLNHRSGDNFPSIRQGKTSHGTPRVKGSQENTSTPAVDQSRQILRKWEHLGRGGKDHPGLGELIKMLQFLLHY